MATEKDITVGLRLEAKGFQKGLNTASNEAKKFGNTLAKGFGGLGKKFGNLGKMLAGSLMSPLGIALSAGGIGVGLYKSIESALDSNKLNATIKKSLENAGKGADYGAMLGIADSMQNAFNIDKNEVKQGIQIALSNGIDPKQIEAISSLASDVHKATGEEIKEVYRDLSEALQGETTVLEKYGIWYEKTGDRATDSATAVKLLSDAYKGQAKAISASESPMKRIQGMGKNLTESIGQKLLPVMSQVSDFLKQILESPAFASFLEMVIASITHITQYVMQVINFIKSIFESVLAGNWGNAFINILIAIINTSIQMAKTALQGLISFAVATIITALKYVWDTVLSFVDIVSTWVMQIPMTVGRLIKKIAGMIADEILLMLPTSWLPDFLTDTLKSTASNADLDVMDESRKDINKATSRSKNRYASTTEMGADLYRNAWDYTKQSAVDNASNIGAGWSNAMSNMDSANADYINSQKSNSPDTQVSAQNDLYNKAQTNMASRWAMQEQAIKKKNDAQKDQQNMFKLMVKTGKGTSATMLN